MEIRKEIKDAKDRDDVFRIGWVQKVKAGGYGFWFFLFCWRTMGHEVASFGPSNHYDQPLDFRNRFTFTHA
jgi:hypothetical protein